MMRTLLIVCCSLFAFAATANAGVEERAAELHAQMKGKHDYHAYLARELASVAEEELAQHDINTARSFMEMAEEHAAKAGGAK